MGGFWVGQEDNMDSFTETKLQTITTDELISRYEVLLIDAFGVLRDTEGPLPGAFAFIEKLNKLKKSFYILTNGSLYPPEQTSSDYAKKRFCDTGGKNHFIWIVD